MARTARSKDQPTEAQILEISQGELTVSIIGTSPVIFNRMSEKAKRTLLMGGIKKNAAERAGSIKHDPVQEFRASAYCSRDANSPTLLQFPAPGIKGSIRTAALDMPGSTKAEIGRRIWIPSTHVAIYGVPRLLMSVVRSADAAKTPDIRTRAIVNAWCATVVIRFAQPLVTVRQITTLFAAGGILCGIGDWRQEKGSGSYGQFRLCSPDAADFRAIIKAGGRAAQEKGLADAICEDADTEELLAVWQEEILRRGRDAAEPKTRKPRESVPPAFVVAPEKRGPGRPRKANGATS